MMTPNAPIEGAQGLGAAASGSPSSSPDRCVRCVLPRSLKAVSFDAEGVCSCCGAHEQEAAAGTGTAPDTIAEKIEHIRELGRGRPYDCLVGLSGGRDSSYLAYLLSRKHGLRCLAAYYRTPFTPDVIDANVHRIADRLNLKLVTMDIDPRLHRDVARKYFTIWLRHPLPEIVNLCCVVCKFVNREAFRIARRHDVRAIVFGGNRFERVQFLPTFRKESGNGDGHSFGPQVRKLARTFRKGIALLARVPAAARYLPLSARASLLYLSPHSAWLRLRYPDIYRLDYFMHTSWNQAECMRTVRDKLGWELPADCLITWKADCEFAELKNYMFRKAAGGTYTEAMLSNLIRDGQITRADAMKILDRPSGSVSWPRIDRVLAQLGVPPETVDGRPREQRD